jgi:hypothetical protein
LRKFDNVTETNEEIIDSKYLNNLRLITRADYTQFDITEEKSFLYVCAALLTKCIDYHKNCKSLQRYFNTIRRSSSMNVENRHVNFRKYATYVNVPVVPPDGFVFNIKMMERVFLSSFEYCYLTRQVGMTVYNHMRSTKFASLCPCFPRDYLYKLFVRMRIYLTVNSNNKAFRSSRDRRKYFCVPALLGFGS